MNMPMILQHFPVAQLPPEIHQCALNRPLILLHGCLTGSQTLHIHLEFILGFLKFLLQWSSSPSST